MKRNLNRLIKRTLNETQLLLERPKCWEDGNDGPTGKGPNQSCNKGGSKLGTCVDRGGGGDCCYLSTRMCHGGMSIGGGGVRMAESELIDTIERIVNEQMMLGFGNTQGMSLGITKPSDKYEEELEEELEEDDTTGTTYNVNVSNKSADPNYTDDGMGMFESILRNNIMKYKNR